uniref:Uncharacterized protein LOC100371731 n=1 Tax=Saccoglossus kowalevskii TaxID=10224 RepID=A0ABM0MHR9_SACKO
MNVPRVKRERRRRGQAQLPWQESTWVQSFAGDAPSPIKVSDLNPGFALRQIVLLMEKRKFDDCSQLVNQMNQLTLKTIMPEMPVDVFIEEIPYSLVILESLFSKLFIADPDSFPVITLKVENILLRIVRFLARQEDPNAQKFSKIDQADKAIASILRIIAFVEPEIMKTLRSRKRMMETVLEGMGGHGLVSIDNSLMTLHDALKLEFEQNIIAYKAALQKLEDLSLSHSKPMTLKNISTGSARTAAPSHHKLMKVNQDQIQVRLYKNKSLLNVVEPSMRSKLPNLLQFLQDCIENDKGALLAFGQLRKEIKTIPQDVKVAPIIAQYTRGLRKVLEIFKRVSDENPTDMMNMPGDGYHSDEDTVLTIEHTLHSQDESDQLCVDSGISSGTQSPDKTSSDAGDIATTSKNGSDMEVITLGQGKDIRRKQERGRQRNKEKSRRGRSKERRSISIDRDDIKHSITRPRRNSVEESTELRVMIDRINKMAAATGQRSRSRSCSRDRSEPHPPARKHLKSAKEWLWSDLNLTGEVENQRDGSSADSQSNNSVEINGSSMNGRVSPMEVKIFKSSREKLFSDEIERLKTELAKCKDTIQLLQQREKQLMTRLSDTSQRHLYRKASEQPAVDLINAYTKLYTESRQDALDVLDVMSD